FLHTLRTIGLIVLVMVLGAAGVLALVMAANRTAQERPGTRGFYVLGGGGLAAAVVTLGCIVYLQVIAPTPQSPGEMAWRDGQGGEVLGNDWGGPEGRNMLGKQRDKMPAPQEGLQPMAPAMGARGDKKGGDDGGAKKGEMRDMARKEAAAAERPPAPI